MPKTNKRLKQKTFKKVVSTSGSKKTIAVVEKAMIKLYHWHVRLDNNNKFVLGDEPGFHGEFHLMSDNPTEEFEELKRLCTAAGLSYSVIHRQNGEGKHISYDKNQLVIRKFLQRYEGTTAKPIANSTADQKKKSASTQTNYLDRLESEDVKNHAAHVNSMIDAQRNGKGKHLSSDKEIRAVEFFYEICNMEEVVLFKYPDEGEEFFLYTDKLCAEFKKSKKIASQCFFATLFDFKETMRMLMNHFQVLEGDVDDRSLYAEHPHEYAFSWFFHHKINELFENFLKLRFAPPWGLGHTHQVIVRKDTIINDVLKDVWFLDPSKNRYGAQAFQCYQIIDHKFHENLGFMKLEDKDFGKIEKEIKTCKRFSDYEGFKGEIYFQPLEKYNL